MLKENYDISGKNIYDFFNDCVDEEDFSSNLKLAFFFIMIYIYTCNSHNN